MWAAEPSGVHMEWGHGLSVVATKEGDIPIQSSQEAPCRDQEKEGHIPGRGQGREEKSIRMAGREQGVSVTPECDSSPLKDGSVGGRWGGTEAEARDS